MARRNLFVLLVALLCLPLFAFGCDCGGHATKSHHPIDDDASPDDDDASPDDDDTSPDDDDSSPDDDDSSPDDDDVSPVDDDDSGVAACCVGEQCTNETELKCEDAHGVWHKGKLCFEHPCADDDTTPLDDDDTSPSDDDTTPPDDDTTPPDDDTTPSDDDDNDNDDETVDIEYIAGGTFSGAAVAESPTGQVYVVSGKSRELRVYRENVSGWTYEVAVFGVYANPSAALGPDGSLHLAYYDWFAQTLRYATNKTGAWADELVDGTADAGHYSAIAVDANGVVHIIYDIESARTPIGVRHAYNVGSGWVTEPVTSGSHVGDFPAMALDGVGRPYVTFNNAGAATQEIDLAVRADNGWQTEAIPYSNPYGRASGVAVESNGTLHIIYHGSDTGLRYATGPYTSLSSVQIAGADNVADSISAALDANGVTHFAYADSAVGVMYGNNVGNTWTLQPLGSGYPVFIAANSVNDVAISIAALGAYRKNSTGWAQTYFDYGFTAVAPNLCRDPLGRLHFVYMESATTTFWHAVGAGAGWTFERIANTIGSGATHFGIVADASSHIHISFYNGLNFGLNYATNANGAWATSIIDGSHGVGSDSSITVDGSGALHVSYSDDTNGYLKYATNASGSWQNATVDQSGLVGASSDIAVDGAGVVYIAYTNQSLNSIELAKGNINGFATSAVDSGGGNYVSIALDSQNQPQIAYVGAGLRHAGYTGSGWVLETVDASALSSGTSIKVVDGDAIAIAYQHVGYVLNLATGSAHDWLVRTIDGLDNAGQSVSLVAAANGLSYDFGYLSNAAIWLTDVEFVGK